MKKIAILVGVLVLLLAMITPSAALAKPGHSVIVVPRDYATIQEAVDAASPGDTIKVQAGEYAGATIGTKVTLTGSSAGTVIKNLPGSPLYRGLAYMPVGFWLSGEEADGTSISHFTFDGAGVGDFLPDDLRLRYFR